MKNWFKPITRRDAVVVSVIIGAVIIYFAASIIKDMRSGLVFNDLRPSFLMLFILVFIEYGMLVIIFGKKRQNVESVTDDTDGDPGQDQR